MNIFKSALGWIAFHENERNYKPMGSPILLKLSRESTDVLHYRLRMEDSYKRKGITCKF